MFIFPLCVLLVAVAQWNVCVAYNQFTCCKISFTSHCKHSVCAVVSWGVERKVRRCSSTGIPPAALGSWCWLGIPFLLNVLLRYDSYVSHAREGFRVSHFTGAVHRAVCFCVFRRLWNCQSSVGMEILANKRRWFYPSIEHVTLFFNSYLLLTVDAAESV